MADFHVLQYERDDGVKRSKPNWPPGPVGHRFFVLKNDSSKWPSSTFIRSESRVMFVVTNLGIQCCHSGCSTRNFGEVEKQGMTNHTSSLFHCDKHIGACHPPPSREAPRIEGFFKPSKKKISAPCSDTSSSSSSSSSSSISGEISLHVADQTSSAALECNAYSGAAPEDSVTIRHLDGANESSSMSSFSEQRGLHRNNDAPTGNTNLHTPVDHSLTRTFDSTQETFSQLRMHGSQQV